MHALGRAGAGGALLHLLATQQGSQALAARCRSVPRMHHAPYAAVSAWLGSAHSAVPPPWPPCVWPLQDPVPRVPKGLDYKRCGSRCVLCCAVLCRAVLRRAVLCCCSMLQASSGSSAAGGPAGPPSYRGCRVRLPACGQRLGSLACHAVPLSPSRLHSNANMQTLPLGVHTHTYTHAYTRSYARTHIHACMSTCPRAQAQVRGQRQR